MFLFISCSSNRSLDQFNKVYISVVNCENRVEILQINFSEKKFMFWSIGGMGKAVAIPYMYTGGVFHVNKNKIFFSPDKNDINDWVKMPKILYQIKIDGHESILDERAYSYWQTQKKFDANFSFLFRYPIKKLSKDMIKYLNEQELVNLADYNSCINVINDFEYGYIPKKLEKYLNKCRPN